MVVLYTILPARPCQRSLVQWTRGRTLEVDDICCSKLNWKYFAPCMEQSTTFILFTEGEEEKVRTLVLKSHVFMLKLMV